MNDGSFHQNWLHRIESNTVIELRYVIHPKAIIETFLIDIMPDGINVLFRVKFALKKVHFFMTESLVNFM